MIYKNVILVEKLLLAHLSLRLFLVDVPNLNDTRNISVQCVAFWELFHYKDVILPIQWSYDKDKMVSQPSYRYHVNRQSCKDGHYILRQGLDS